MDVRSSLASRLYGNLSGAVQPQKSTPDMATGGERSPIASSAMSFIDTLQNAEDTARAGLVGRAEPQSVVMALASSEFAVETAVTMRNKVVEAYQEILRMPV
ncbi:MAG: flagellar hook-basal body complex protein FliE [Paracoccaceae bacterium]|jgi:flagellar hook-basal body complex protein FliE